MSNIDIIYNILMCNGVFGAFQSFIMIRVVPLSGLFLKSVN